MAYERYDFKDDSSESDDSKSLYSQSDRDIPWLDKISPKGELFYIQQNFSQSLEKNFLTIIPVDQHNTSSNAAKKLTNWLKKKKHKVRRPFKLFKSIKLNENSMPFDLLSSKEVFIALNPLRSSLNRKTSLSKDLLGIELGRFEECNNLDSMDKIKILKCCEIPDLKPGDWLHSINDIEVYLSNIDDVLLQLDFPSKIKLTVLSPYNDSSTFKSIFSKHNHICDELLGGYDILEKIKSHSNYGVFFFKCLETHKNEAAGKDVAYEYPKEHNHLCNLKGMFITLSHIIRDVASPQILSCSMAVRQEMVHVGFFKEKNYIFLLAIPAAFASEKDVQYFMKNVVQHLKFRYQYLKCAFLSDNFNVDKFFALFFKYILSEQSDSLSYLNAILPSAHWIPLSAKLKTEIDDILTELESSDFDCFSGGFTENQRFYNILGSCFFYKGYLLCNHLMKSDFLDIHSFLNYNHLFLLTKVQAVSEMIIWNEVYPNRFTEMAHYSDNNEYRYFLLAVAMGNSILSVLLESNGGTLEPEAHPPPDPFYVEEVQNTLIILHNYGIVSAVERSLPQTVNLKGVNESSKSVQCSSNASSCDVESSYSEELSNERSNFNTGSTSGSQASSESQPQQNNFHDDSLSDALCYFNAENSVFHFLHMDPIEGVFLAPPLEEYSFYNDCGAKNDILFNFHRCCMQMRCFFSRSLRNKEIHNSGIITKFGIDGFLCNVYEQGILFSYSGKDKKKQKNMLNFWIIGRLFFNPEPREVYVCFHDSVHQDIVELAFKLGFGLSL